MANTKTGKKQMLINRRNRARNLHYKTRMKTAIKAFKAALEAGSDISELKRKLVTAQKIISVTASKGVIKKQTASRKISKLYTSFNRMLSAGDTGRQG